MLKQIYDSVETLRGESSDTRVDVAEIKNTVEKLDGWAFKNGINKDVKELKLQLAKNTAAQTARKDIMRSVYLAVTLLSVIIGTVYTVWLSKG